MNIFYKSVARVLIVTVTYLCWPAMEAGAEMMPTIQAAALASPQDPSVSRSRVESLLAREDVRTELEARGVNYDQAKSRIASLSDDEVNSLAGKLDTLPAGGDGFLGAVAFIFIVLLITDILGLTKVFSFTRSVR